MSTDRVGDPERMHTLIAKLLRDGPDCACRVCTGTVDSLKERAMAAKRVLCTDAAAVLDKMAFGSHHAVVAVCWDPQSGRRAAPTATLTTYRTCPYCLNALPCETSDNVKMYIDVADAIIVAAAAALLYARDYCRTELRTRTPSAVEADIRVMHDMLGGFVVERMDADRQDAPMSCPPTPSIPVKTVDPQQQAQPEKPQQQQQKTT